MDCIIDAIIENKTLLIGMEVVIKMVNFIKFRSVDSEKLKFEKIYTGGTMHNYQKKKVRLLWAILQY